MLINLKSLSPVIVMINSMSVPICNGLHTRRANMVKNNVFLEEVHIFDVHVRKEFPHLVARNFVTTN